MSNQVPYKYIHGATIDKTTGQVTLANGMRFQVESGNEAAKYPKAAITMKNAIAEAYKTGILLYKGDTYMFKKKAYGSSLRAPERDCLIKWGLISYDKYGKGPLNLTKKWYNEPYFAEAYLELWAYSRESIEWYYTD